MFRPAWSLARSLFQTSLPVLASKDCTTSLAEKVYTRPPCTAGVERGPSPPRFSLVPSSPPSPVFMDPKAAVHSSLPVLASRATRVSSMAPPESRSSWVKQRPPATANELKPALLGTFHSTLGPLAGQVVAIFSGVAPSWWGPRYSVQSAPWETSEVAMRAASAKGRCMG